MNLKDYKGKKPKKLEKVDELLLKELQLVVNSATKYFEQYEYSRAKAETEKFFWKVLTDNYIEIVKKRIYTGKGDKKLSAQYTLYHSLLTILKLIAPIMPYITEEIYQTYFKKLEKDKSIHTSKWPEVKKVKDDGGFSDLVNLISKVRQEKTKAKKAMNTEITLTIDKKDKTKLKNVLNDLKDVTNASDIKEGKFKVEFK